MSETSGQTNPMKECGNKTSKQRAKEALQIAVVVGLAALAAISVSESERTDREMAELRANNVYLGSENARLAAWSSTMGAENQRLSVENQRMTGENRRLAGILATAEKTLSEGVGGRVQEAGK